MGVRNAEVLAGVSQGSKRLSVAAMDFDSSVAVLSDFYDPAKLAELKVFDAIDSYGDTDIAAAVRASTAMLLGMYPAPATPDTDLNKPRIYLLSDLDNNAGWNVVKRAIDDANAKGIETHMGHLQPIKDPTKSSRASGDLYGEKPLLAKVAEKPDGVIAAILAGGGSYTVIESAQAQQQWVELMDELSQTLPFSRTSVNLPLNVKYYGFAQSTGNPEPLFIFKATTSGQVTITMDGKGSFVPDLKVAGAGTQVSQGQDLYTLPFNVEAGKSYQININKPATAAGLYSIVLRQTGGPVVSEPTMTLATIGTVTEGTAPVVSGTTTNVADGSAVTITFDTATKAGTTKALTKATTVVNATVANNAFSATGPTNLPVGTTTMTVSIPGSGIAPQTQTFTVQAKAAPPVGTATPVPVDNPVALLVLAMAIAGFAGRKHLKSRR